MIHAPKGGKKKRKQPKQAVFEEIQIWDLADKDFKAAIINMFEELRESMFKESEDSVVMTHVPNGECASERGRSCGAEKRKEANEKFASAPPPQIRNSPRQTPQRWRGKGEQ